MKSDVIRKRSRHDARRGSGSGIGSGNLSETPSASPGASRRTSPHVDGDGGFSPTLVADSNASAFDDLDVDSASGHNDGSGGSFGYMPPTQSELIRALGTTGACSYPSLNSSKFPGPYHPDLLSHMYSTDYAGDTSEGEGGVDMRCAKRRRMSNDSATEPPSSAVSYYSFGGDNSGFSTSSSVTSCSSSARSSMDFSFFGSCSSPPSNGNNDCCNSPTSGGNSSSCNPTTTHNNGTAVAGYYSSYWHPPMLPQPHGSPFIHPPMLPPSSSTADNDVHMDFLLPEPHPPMFPSDWTSYPTDGASGF
jgi:GATA-binding protein, other eukaryote